MLLSRPALSPRLLCQRPYRHSVWAVDLVGAEVRLGRVRPSRPAVLVFPRVLIATKKNNKGVGTAGRLPFVIRGKEHPTKNPWTRRALVAYQGSTIGPRRSIGLRFPLHRVNLARRNPASEAYSVLATR